MKIEIRFSLQPLAKLPTLSCFRFVDRSERRLSHRVTISDARSKLQRTKVTTCFAESLDITCSRLLQPGIEVGKTVIVAMLKGRSKIFAPKKITRTVPRGSAPSKEPGDEITKESVEPVATVPISSISESLQTLSSETDGLVSIPACGSGAYGAEISASTNIVSNSDTRGQLKRPSSEIIQEPSAKRLLLRLDHQVPINSLQTNAIITANSLPNICSSSLTSSPIGEGVAKSCENSTALEQSNLSKESDPPTEQIIDPQLTHPGFDELRTTSNVIEDEYISSDHLRPASGHLQQDSPSPDGLFVDNSEPHQNNLVNPIANNPKELTGPAEALSPCKSNKPATRIKRKYTKRARPKSDEISDGSSLQITGKKVTKKRGRKKREATPDGSEYKTIDTSVITMQELCKDLRIGKKSRNHDEIMGRLARAKQNAIKAKFQQDFPDLVAVIDGKDKGTPNPKKPGSKDENDVNRMSPSPTFAPSAGPRMRIVDGQIVTDEQSLQIDRHERARINNNDEEELIEENDFTRIVSSNNYLRRERSQHWDLPGNELFWKGLRMFGTDFEMIANMFPNRSRRQIKLKFNAEERANPRKVNRVLMGIKTEAIDLDEFQRLGNFELEDVADLRAEEARIEKEQSEQFEAIEKAKQAEDLRRKAEIRSGSTAMRLMGEFGDTSHQISQVTKKRPKKNIHSAYGGGEEAIVLETVE
ncbi:ranscription factor TFIIIB component [Blumeria hordei DH14]|uniref:Ranscription factor TFIIIB component n=2 Tax=Blumeria hordei TaxID=2867405 RepID=N1JHV5_BLUG1|nr:ranscription factor TFIIIB component [Blumeria hordei DH14]